MKAKDTEPKPTPKPAIVLLDPGDLHPCAENRPDRSGFDDKSLQELANSITAQGIIEPLVVRLNPDGKKGYELVCGERRWAAAKLAKVKARGLIRLKPGQQVKALVVDDVPANRDVLSQMLSVIWVAD